MNTVKCLAMAFLISVTWFGYARITSDIHLFNAIQLSKHNDQPNTLAAAYEARDSNPYDKTALAIIGRSLILSGNIKGGTKFLEKHLKSYPYDAATIINLGIAYLLTGKHKEAYGMRTRVKAISPEYAKYINLKREG